MSPNLVNSVNPVSTSSAQPVAVISSRIAALDWVKGALVVFMVVYHALGYSAFRPMSFQYLSFLPPSFILIAGFLVGQVYASKYDLKSWQPYLRLAFRGFKLLALFTVLNVVNCILIEKSFYFGFWLFADRGYDIFVSGNGRVGVFEVLLPIAYFLLLAPVLLWLRGQIAFIIPVLAGAVLLFCIFLERRGTGLDNLSLLSSGFIGMAFGLVSMEKINRFAANWIPVLLAYLAYRLVSHFYGETYAVQILAAIVSLLLLYCCGAHLNVGTWTWRQMVLLGNNSLFGYLAQIVLLRLIVTAFGGLPQQWSVVVAVTLLTTLFLFLIILAVAKLREKSKCVDVTYKTIFA